MDIINNAILYILDVFQSATGSYAMAIILITILIRVLLWPLNSSQTRSMKKMQELQPKMKEMQEKYKDNPMKMQEKMLEFYKENKFNPFAGCLPMLVQLPIFIGLFGALNSPDFMALAGNEQFFFIDRLHHTLHGHGGDPMDGRFSIEQGDTFESGKVAVISLKSGRVANHPVKEPGHVITVTPSPMIPGEPIRLKLNLEKLGVSTDYDQLSENLVVPVLNQKTRELEKVTFLPAQNSFAAEVPTDVGQFHIENDVLILLVLYGLITLLYQKVMQKGQPATTDPTQAQMMKLMPIMFVVMMFFIPMPAGVVLYLDVTMILMLVQTMWVHWREDSLSNKSGGSGHKPGAKPSNQVVDVKPE